MTKELHRRGIAARTSAETRVVEEWVEPDLAIIEDSRRITEAEDARAAEQAALLADQQTAAQDLARMTAALRATEVRMLGLVVGPPVGEKEVCAALVLMAGEVAGLAQDMQRLARMLAALGPVVCRHAGGG